ncbi:hypothetical protein BJ546DRAFT_117766 [Cryomyces antarcticus]
MFCLRSWIPVLFFLTNASPIYLLLFVTATYFLNRPCVYCSLLLAILVISLFDFQSNWFEPRYNNALSAKSTPSTPHVPGSVQNVPFETVSLIASAINDTMVSLAGAALEGVKRRTTPTPIANGSGAEWMKSLLGKKEWRIPCVDVLVRL